MYARGFELLPNDLKWWAGRLAHGRGDLGQRIYMAFLMPAAFQLTPLLGAHDSHGSREAPLQNTESNKRSS